MIEIYMYWLKIICKKKCSSLKLRYLLQPRKKETADTRNL